jgi:class 3 adenylate cyclase
MSTEHDLFGLTVDKAARVAAIADAGEIMISSITRDLVGSIEGTRMAEAEVVALKGLSNTHQIVAVKWD